MKLIHRKISTIDDGEILILLNELQAVSGVPVAHFSDQFLQHYLKQCLFPNGGGTKAMKISKDDLDQHDPTNDFILRKKVTKVGDDLFQVFRELAELVNEEVEKHSGSSIYMFLNKTLAPTKSKKKNRIFWNEY